MTGEDATPVNIHRVGGPQRAEREGAALMEAAERATAPRPSPVAFEEVSPNLVCIAVDARTRNSGWTIT